jgi:hypothetical protein
MPATAINDPVGGESLVGTEPQLEQYTSETCWRERLNLFTGRTLSDTALDSEQLYRSGLLATLGQSVTPGTVKGLALSLDATGSVVTLTPGYGIMATGDDVILNTPIQTPLATLTVANAHETTLTAWQADKTSPFAGILLLRPVVAQVSGQQLDTGGLPTIVSGNLGASCSQDPLEFPFDDWQIADAFQLVFFPWPAGVANLPLPAPAPAETLRNRLAYTVFEAESMLGPDDVLPWASFGVPVGLIAFDPAWKPLFLDCASVVRAGGLPRHRAALPSEPDKLTQWLPAAIFAQGDYVVDPSGNTQVAQSDTGTTGLKPPAWAANFGDTTTDGTVTWKQNGSVTWHPNTTVKTGQFILDPNGYRQTVLTEGVTGSTEPGWSGVYLPTADGAVTWVNDGSGAQPIVQPAQAQAQVYQLAEQLRQMLAGGVSIQNLCQDFPTMPPSGILPLAAVDLVNHKAPWLPPNWSLSAAPVKLEELESVLEIGMRLAPIEAANAAPANPDDLEPVEILVPLPDAVYDPNILVVETVAPAFQQAVDTAESARNLTLQQLSTVEQEVNALQLVIGPNNAQNPNLIDIDAGLLPGEVTARQTPPPYSPQPAETFGAVLQTTWAASRTYTAGEFAIDSNGNLQVAQTGGVSSPSQPASWSTTPGQTTTDFQVTWLSNGPWAWQPDTPYVPGQFVIDPTGTRHTVTTAGTSASDAPKWNDLAGGSTQDGILWRNGGKELWKPDTLYSPGELILDATGNIQLVLTGGISGDSVPSWNPNPGQATSDSAVVWKNLGHNGWQAGTSYIAGQAILDSRGDIQTVLNGGTSGTTAPPWSVDVSGHTEDTSVVWNNAGTLLWQATPAYNPGAIILDSNGNLQTTVAGGQQGAAAPEWATTPGATTTDGAITWICMAFQSVDLENVLANIPSTTPFVDAAAPADPVTASLLSAADQTMLASGGAGLQALITSLNARIARVNDLLDTAFLTTQTDIYRYRQHVLGATAASTLATSPILANIATGETAEITAANLQGYVQTLLGSTTTTMVGGTSTTTTTVPPVYHPPVIRPTPAPVFNSPGGRTPQIFRPMLATRASVVSESIAHPAVSPLLKSQAINTISQPQAISTMAQPEAISTISQRPGLSMISQLPTFKPISTISINTGETARLGNVINSVNFNSPTQILVPNQNVGVSSQTILEQSPLVGAQINLRTLTVAQRLQQSPSQEALFYSIANRLNFLHSLQALQTSTGDPYLITSDLTLVVDGTPAGSTPQGTQTPVGNGNAPAGSPTSIYYYSAWQVGGASQGNIVAAVQSPYLAPDSSEATVFSVGIRVLEQHAAFLRALEARVQQYSTFVSLCQTALSNMQGDIQQARTYLTQLSNNLHQQRQNVAFTTALLADEQARVASVNAQRQQVLTTQVQLVAYTRARTLQATDTTPSRQLLPASIANPVPATLEQTVAVPPELRELIGQLREAPVNWLPAAAALLPRLRRPIDLQQLGLHVQSRATLLLQSPRLPSSSVGESRVYSSAISTVYSSNQTTFRSFIAQRTTFQPSVLNSLSWNSQVLLLQSYAALNDLISSEASYTEVTNEVALLIQQISRVATGLYTRVSAELPIDRLAWAEYLSGPGSSVALPSLAILPTWNTLGYADRQQMQMLVDWLFQQVDNSNAQATAFMSDVVRTAILLASDVPVDHIIPAGITQRVRPILGTPIYLNLASDRIAAGMFVNLYSGATLAARAVVSDLDPSTVTAHVTDVYKPGAYLETTDVAHITAQKPLTVALRSAFAMS